jgi:tetratricopeptide (TPR) repeat protein
MLFTVGMVILDALAPILLMIGLTMIMPGTVSLPSNFEIVATTLTALFIFKEAINKRLCRAIDLIIISSIISRMGTAAGNDDQPVTERGVPVDKDHAASGENYLERIFDTIAHENSRETENYKEITESNENNSEISVDTGENIDKMGIENNVHDSDFMTIDECIEEAFRLKAQGDLESAIIYFMYALDRNPAQELVFWIVLDICVMYKSLGQVELAFDILNSCHDSFGNIMDEAVRKEIEENLASMQA